jgi:hypothetical protein
MEQIVIYKYSHHLSSIEVGIFPIATFFLSFFGDENETPGLHTRHA